MGKRLSRRSRAAYELDEPIPEGEEWVEYGGELIWEAGTTEGGAPYGLSLDEWQRDMRTDASGAGWCRARDILQTLIRLQSLGGAQIELGRVTHVGRGMYREAYATTVEIEPDENALSGAWVVLLPRDDVDHDSDSESPLSCSGELQVLAALNRRQASAFRTPRPLGCLPDRYGSALVREFVPGIPLDLRAGRQATIRPWEVVARIAAEVHALDASELVSLFPDAPMTRRDHARRMLRSLETLQLAEARDALSWAEEHLPPDEPTVLLHGDLLGHNILIDPMDERPFALIDWGFASMGDPAYDLAIITRCVRRPFQVGGGLERMLDCYAAACSSQLRVTREQVRLHELCLAARWCATAMASAPGSGSESVADATARLRRVLTMATSVRA